MDPMVRAHAALKSAAVTLFKIVNDLRWLSSGPRSGLQLSPAGRAPRSPPPPRAMVQSLPDASGYDE